MTSVATRRLLAKSFLKIYLWHNEPKGKTGWEENRACGLVKLLTWVTLISFSLLLQYWVKIIYFVWQINLFFLCFNESAQSKQLLSFNFIFFCSVQWSHWSWKFVFLHSYKGQIFLTVHQTSSWNIWFSKQVDQLVSLCQVAAEGVATAAPPKTVNNRAEEVGLGALGWAVFSQCVLLEDWRTRPELSKRATSQRFAKFESRQWISD